MKRQPVESSNLVSVGYENDVLEIAFKANKVYDYFGVPHSVYAALIRAESVGEYFDENIKGHYLYQRVL